MPWNAEQMMAKSKKLTQAQAARAATVANGALAQGRDEGEAIRIGLAAANKMAGKGKK